jgi:hypothetical protein
MAIKRAVTYLSPLEVIYLVLSGGPYFDVSWHNNRESDDISVDLESVPLQSRKTMQLDSG